MCDMGRMADRLLYADEAAALAGISRQAWVTYVNSRTPKSHPAPEPDELEIDRGHARPRWRESRVRAWIAGRPGSPGRPRNAG
jgi:predicted DNA-binding transcriptional regulator AlpA